MAYADAFPIPQVSQVSSRPQRRLRGWLALAGAAVLLAGCMSGPPPRIETTPSGTAPPTASPQKGRLQAASWAELGGWAQDDVRAAWPALQQSCQALKKRAEWSRACAAGMMVNAGDINAMRAYFESNFQPYRVVNGDGTDSGLITGYYEPILHGSRTRQGRFQVPLYRKPAQFGNRALPARAELLQNPAMRGNELVWVDDAVEAAFLQIQGSGRIRMADGSMMRVGFGGTNEQPFRSFGKWLLDRGEITPAQATMQGIKAWARANPGRVEEMLNVNPRFVFFRELPPSNDGPVGALGVPLTAERSIAVDPATIPLGVPVFLSTTRPLSTEPIQRLMFAQDTGSAIKGGVRADFFWGAGDAAGETAGRMKQGGRMWVLMPRS
ncbi:murein transglycosylase A [Cupriavidus taiwanensis]|uniref:peptidoglycan lytic exotransglycosylase n=1 Tax=Cupriavidus taiwanensis TaxID=164546 RepID=A0A7Z7NKS0_9BURK|nr:MltA domain-containing protein [Cupriavidus taiwanensis]SOY89451.1 MEMBRANE-BOUND LYTIC MUREIN TRANSGLYCOSYLASE A [Cupriavidus taiwanensis]SOZ03359.1 MEMBRANE-BOUND LYTIC MUREIN TRANSGLYCOSYLASE A [Cupriavidus taiwanensis]SOZ08846.1 MEMBRANE-BOUND LYTIC MUREIN TRANSGLYCOSYLASE A [Cupriavidus taiwanensis]SPC07148.1 MEMBRANE-BOUND LYTIC MUREIN TRANSGLYCOSYLASE A [Cupriavidus taiwanensis]SPD41840.1 MEMBRANE-BOUND LYTIC MUREIN TRANSGLYCOSYLASE A [Cupriavidus taiwanensis]